MALVVCERSELPISLIAAVGAGCQRSADLARVRKRVRIDPRLPLLAIAAGAAGLLLMWRTGLLVFMV